MSSLRWKRVGCFSVKNKNRLWITVPVSGLLTLYFIRLIKIWITIITKRMSNELGLLPLEIFIVLVTFVSIMILIFKVGLPYNNKKKKLLTFLISICAIFTLFSYMISVGNKQLNNFFVLFTYIFFNLLTYLVYDVILIVYKWLIKDESTMAPKLTLIWALITFLIAILFKF